MRVQTRVVAAGLLLAALLMAGIVSRFASDDPDGLTKVSEDQGFAQTEKAHDSLVGGYGAVTGVLGVLLVLGLAGGLTYAVRHKDSQHSQDSQGSQDERP
jgi:cobalt/nickel transport protein